ncbi:MULTISPECIES: hypothetical protein [unclassified Pseudoalteromonas]|uniref:hypothetical protein n=1 Tax=unclassified Pseudoalteromonas TaxID=194690 RepID=UPI001107EB1A|nr:MULTISPECIES: hypothetical protein [unclassified Pseudoalteromonas]MBB1293022.1 hypothetical protein [Pseudoalteromonas sp. SR41-4]TMN67298.1 hypothetical protein CWB85_19810 [Pseudoalteromonas sp. S1727]
MHLFEPIILWPQLTNIVSALSIDVDPDAERLQVFDRKSGTLIWHQRVSGQFFKFFPKETALNPSLMCVILDDNEQFNAQIADHIQGMLVDAVVFDPTNPLPYEPPVA